VQTERNGIREKGEAEEVLKQKLKIKRRSKEGPEIRKSTKEK
jgi:hypothetical protein